MSELPPYAVKARLDKRTRFRVLCGGQDGRCSGQLARIEQEGEHRVVCFDIGWIDDAAGVVTIGKKAINRYRDRTNRAGVAPHSWRPDLPIVARCPRPECGKCNLVDSGELDAAYALIPLSGHGEEVGPYDPDNHSWEARRHPRGLGFEDG